MPKKVPFLLLCILASLCFDAAMLSAQELDTIEPQEEPARNTRPPQDFFIGIGGAVSLYSAFDFAYGGNLTIGYGTGSVLGLNFSWFLCPEDVDTLELNIFLRFYLFGTNANSGPYIQAMGGPVVFFDNNGFKLPAEIGEFSCGAGFGWRFIFSKNWFVEPNIRAGYPYIVSTGVTAGVRF